MYKKISINLLFIILIFSGCSQKVNNISKNESYKLLDEIVVVAEQKSLDITNAPSSGMNVNYVNWGNGTGMSPVFTPNYSISSTLCKNESESYSNEIINNMSKFKDLFTIHGVRINSIYEPTKKLLKISPEKYDCANNYIYVKATLYDVENISKNWNKTNVQQTVKQIESLDDKNIIYQNMFVLDKTYSAFSVDDFKKDSFANVEKKATNIEKFYNVVIKDLQKVMNISKVAEPKKSQAEILIDNSPVKKYYDELTQTMKTLTAVMKNGDKKNEAIYEAVNEFSDKYFSYENIKLKLVNIISNNFTEAELVELNAYYNTEIGKKYREKLPKIISDMQVKSISIFEEKKDILSKMMQERVIKLKNNEKEMANILAKNMNREFKIEPTKKNIKKEVNKSQAEILLDKPIYEEMFLKGIKMGIEEKIKQAPQLLLFKDIMEEFVSKYINYEEFKPAFIKVFNDNFTQDELSQINRFESTKFAEKYNKQFPKIYEEIKTMYQNILIEHKEDLKKIIEEKLKNK
ncbi:DUF2059 domain-containing protein [Aliarcobacter butzleri]|uniref:DUF2059 domain-containing protein n=1 Tax=Aliarcobacter butzleri TaxID=28197 RepID=UPI00125FC2B5|nr:DUF2059 domain-containing protein [Aliarcobacter butzleri]